MRYELRKGKDIREETSDSDFLRSFKKGDTKVRFLEDPDDWSYFEEHFTPQNKSFMCLGSFDRALRDVCPGCTSDVDSISKYSRRYGTSVLLVDRDLVLPFRIPVSLRDKLVRRVERWGGLTDRDVVVMRVGAGLDTEYDVESDDKYELVGAANYRSQMVDVVELLVANFEEQNGPIDAFTGNGKKVEAEPVKKTEYPEDPPSEPSSQREPAVSEDVKVLDENEVRSMNMGQLYKLAEDAEVDVSACETKDQIIDALLSALLNPVS